MRQSKRLKKTLYYANFSSQVPILDENGDDTLETTDGYGVPVKFRASISPNKGEASEEPFGLDLNYTNTIYTVEDLGIEEGSLLWVNKTPPTEASNGETADYICMAVAKALNSTVYAVKKR